MSAATHVRLDEAIQAHFADEHNENAGVVTHWVITAASMNGEGPGVLVEYSDQNAMPTWQIRGLLETARIIADMDEGDDDD